MRKSTTFIETFTYDRAGYLKRCLKELKWILMRCVNSTFVRKEGRMMLRAKTTFFPSRAIYYSTHNLEMFFHKCMTDGDMNTSIMFLSTCPFNFRLLRMSTFYDNHASLFDFLSKNVEKVIGEGLIMTASRVWSNLDILYCRLILIDKTFFGMSMKPMVPWTRSLNWVLRIIWNWTNDVLTRFLMFALTWKLSLKLKFECLGLRLKTHSFHLVFIVLLYDIDTPSLVYMTDTPNMWYGNDFCKSWLFSLYVVIQCTCILVV